MDMAKSGCVTGKNRVQVAIDNMALSYLEIKPKFVDGARKEFEYECQFFLDDAGNEPLQDCMNKVFTDWILFESAVFDSSAIQNYLTNFGGISDEDRHILEQVDSNQAFGFFRFDGLFEDSVNGKGIVVYDPFAGMKISVHSEALYEIARDGHWSTGTGVSMRVAEVDGEHYAIGQFFAHDRAQFNEGMSIVIARMGEAYNVSWMLPLAMDILNPDGRLSKSRELRTVKAA